jgi:hypothetical protein
MSFESSILVRNKLRRHQDYKLQNSQDKLNFVKLDWYLDRFQFDWSNFLVSSTPISTPLQSVELAGLSKKNQITQNCPPRFL